MDTATAVIELITAVIGLMAAVLGLLEARSKRKKKSRRR